MNSHLDINFGMDNFKLMKNNEIEKLLLLQNDSAVMKVITTLEKEAGSMELCYKVRRSNGRYSAAYVSLMATFMSPNRKIIKIQKKEKIKRKSRKDCVKDKILVRYINFKKAFF